MLKKIAVINDISGFGKCSLTVAIPIISALKVQACPLVTGVLSNQTCYSSYFMADMTDSMEEIINKWAELGFSFPDSMATFIFASHDRVPAKEIFEALKRERIYVRYFNQPRIDGYLRITVGTEQEMEALFRFLEIYLKNH